MRFAFASVIQEGNGLGCFYRARIEIALAIVTLILCQQFLVFFGFHTFGNHF